MRSKLLVSTATAAILSGLVFASAQEMPRGGKQEGTMQNQGSPGGAQRGERRQGTPERAQGSQGQRDQGQRDQSKGKQAQPKPDRDRQQTTGQGKRDQSQRGESRREQTQRDQDKREQRKGKQAQPKPDRDRQQTTGQGKRDQNQRGDSRREQTQRDQDKRGQRKDKQAQPKPDRDRDRQTTGQGQRDQDKARQAQPKQAQPSDRRGSDQAAGQDRDRQGRRDGDDRAQGRVDLSVEQRTRIRQSVFARSDVPRVNNVNFSVRVGTIVPTRVRIVAVPAAIVEIRPQFRGHQYFVVRDEIVIVDDRRHIVAVIPVDTARQRMSLGAAI